MHEAVLDVLFHAYDEIHALRPEVISRRAGIYRGSIDRGSLPSHIVRGILGRLESLGRVKGEQKAWEAVRKWRLTKREYNARKS